MRYIVNSDNFVVAVSFGSDVIYNDCFCTEYIGGIPKNYSSLEEWYLKEELTLWRWKIVDGNLTLDSSAVAPEEGQWGVPELQSKTVSPKTSKQTVTADDGFDGLSQVVVNAMTSGALSTPGISVSSNGVITATAEVGTSGYLASGTSKSNTSNMSTQASETVTPGTSQKIAVEKGKYTIGDVYVAGDSKLTAENIKSGVSIFGVLGSYVGANTRFGSAVNASNYSRGSVTFYVETTNLVGFYFACSLSSGDLDGEGIYVVGSGFYYSGNVRVNYVGTDEYGGFDGCWQDENANHSVSVAINTNNITINLSGNYYFGSYNRGMKLIPIYKS